MCVYVCLFMFKCVIECVSVCVHLFRVIGYVYVCVCNRVIEFVYVCVCN